MKFHVLPFAIHLMYHYQTHGLREFKKVNCLKNGIEKFQMNYYSCSKINKNLKQSVAAL